MAAARCLRCREFERCPRCAEDFRRETANRAAEAGARHRREKLEREARKLAVKTGRAACLHDGSPCALCEGRLEPPGEFRRALARHQIRELYHLTSFENLPGILRVGLLSRRLLRELGMAPRDISSARVQEIRADKRVGGRVIQEYVPFFFQTLNAMFSSIRDKRDELVILGVDPSVLVARGVYVCDGNAAGKTVPSPGWAGIASFRWDVIRGHWSDHEDGKRMSQAEALVPDQVPASYIANLYVRTSYGRQRLESLGMSARCTVQPNLFF